MPGGMHAPTTGSNLCPQKQQQQRQRRKCSACDAATQVHPPASGRQRMLFLKLKPPTSAGSSSVSTSPAGRPTCFTSTHTYSTPLASGSLKQSSTAGKQAGRSSGRVGQTGQHWRRWLDTAAYRPKRSRSSSSCQRIKQQPSSQQAAPVTPFFLQKPSSAGLGAPAASYATCAAAVAARRGRACQWRQQQHARVSHG
jgi:hypothetical protein